MPVTSSVLVTGGAGFIGSHVVRAHGDTGAEVTVLDDFRTGRRRNLAGIGGRVRVLRGDVRDRATVDAAMRGARVVYHLAAIVSIPLSMRRPQLVSDVNGQGTLTVLEAALAAGVERFVYSSSTAVYGDVERLPVAEDVPTRPLSPYGDSKLAGERHALAFHAEHGLPTIALRYFNVFGPGQDPSSDYAAVIPRFIAACLRGRPIAIYGDGEQTRDFIHVRDAVRANLLAAEAPDAALGRAFNVASGVGRSVNQVADAIRGITGATVPPVHLAERRGDIRHSVADVALARSLLGFEAETPFEEGLARTVDSFRGTSEGRPD